MNVDEKVKEYSLGFEAGQKHQTSSPMTIKMFQNMEDKIDKLEEKINQIAIDIVKLPEKIFEKSDEKYASKLTEKVVYTLIGLILLAVIGNIITSATQPNAEDIIKELKKEVYAENIIPNNSI